MTKTRDSSVSFGVAIFLISLGVGCETGDVAPDLRTDTGVDLRGDAVETKRAFLSPCVWDEQCESGRCGSFGQESRCTKVCAGKDECPVLSGWSCAEVCICTPVNDTVDKCGMDTDCDGQGDLIQVVETCNEQDDDCNGVVDDVPPNADGATLSYPDIDGDGHGDGSLPSWLCTPKDGFVAVGDDCDDERKDVAPSLEEICGDLFDNDCDHKLEDADVCGFAPVKVKDVAGDDDSARLGQCASGGVSLPGLDMTEVVAKQDTNTLKFSVLLAGSPLVNAACASYKLSFGSKDAADALVFVYRPSSSCSLPRLQAYRGGTLFSSTFAGGFNAANPGHVSFRIPKADLFGGGLLSGTSYWLKACTNSIADAEADKTQCVTDVCEMPVHR